MVKMNYMYMAVIAAVLVAAGVGVYLLGKQQDWWSQESCTGLPKNNCSTGTCKGFVEPKDCGMGNTDRALLSPYKPVPHECHDSSYRNSPHVLPPMSPWIKDMYGPPVPIPGKEPSQNDVSKVFNSCTSYYLDPTSPIGISGKKCTSCDASADPSACLYPRID